MAGGDRSAYHGGGRSRAADARAHRHDEGFEPLATLSVLGKDCLRASLGCGTTHGARMESCHGTTVDETILP
jgi:hypothetical protein